MGQDWQRYLSLRTDLDGGLVGHQGGWAAVIMDPHNKFVRRMAPWRSRAWLASTDTSLEVDFFKH